MGTSSSSTGPKGPGWSTAKATATKYAKGASGVTPQRVVSRVARAIGGTGSGSQWTGGAATAAQRIGGLLGGASADGLAETLDKVGLGDLAGKSTADALFEILDWIAGDSVTLDDQAARRSAEQVLSELLSDGIDSLDQPLNAATAANLFRTFLVEYLTRAVLTPITKRLTENATAKRSKTLERDIGRVIDALVYVGITDEQMGEIDWFGDEGAAVVERLRSEALDLLADAE